jgi:hypothetical protein
LGIPINFPIGAFHAGGAAPGEYSFIEGKHVMSVMRAACVAAYPNLKHYMQVHINLIHSHSNCITAAVAMSNASVPMEIIAARLRWSLNSVKFYLRDCFTQISTLTEKALKGAMMT